MPVYKGAAKTGATYNCQCMKDCGCTNQGKTQTCWCVDPVRFLHAYTLARAHTHLGRLQGCRNHDLNPCLNSKFFFVSVQAQKPVGEGSEFDVKTMSKNGGKKGMCACLCGGQGL